MKKCFIKVLTTNNLYGECVTYTYDMQNRLDSAMHHGYNSWLANYGYSPAGRMWLDWFEGRKNHFAYRCDSTNHQPRYIVENVPPQGHDDAHLFWTADGELDASVSDNARRFNVWNDAGKLTLSAGTGGIGYYAYDATGSRAYKFSGPSAVSGSSLFTVSSSLTKLTLYPCPYTVVEINKDGTWNYTNLYYAGVTHIATHPAYGGFDENSPNWLSETSVTENSRADELFENTFLKLKNKHYTADKYLCLSNGTMLEAWAEYCVENVGINDMVGSSQIYTFARAASEEFCSKDVYHRHGDHLGSAAYVTDYAGDPVQFITYRPYGQLDVNQHTSYDERYKFTGKERDEETGYDYFGARYYGSVFPLWLSVDPLSDKYPDISPYAYCNWNPVIYVDLEGKSYSDFDEEGRYLGTSHDNWLHNTFCGHIGRVLDKNGAVSYIFTFADPHNDFEAVKKGDIKLFFVNDDQVSKILESSGVNERENILNNYAYIYRESNSANIAGSGKMDYVISGEIDGAKISVYDKMLFLTDINGVKVAHNKYNFGNFLWGAGAQRLKIPLYVAQIGAHINNFFNDTNSRYHLDSVDDQLSIMYGYLWGLIHYKIK